jgi:hypothetical protein
MTSFSKAKKPNPSLKFGLLLNCKGSDHLSPLTALFLPTLNSRDLDVTRLFDEILLGKKSINDLVDFVDQLPKLPKY